MEKALRDQIISIIDDVNDMTIATVRQDGFPQATTVSYMNEGLTIYFMTGADSQKAQNIEQNNRVSLTINRDYRNWDEIESLSMGALAFAIDDPSEQQRVGALMLEKFPQAAQIEPTPDIDLRIFKIAPKVISVLDYEKGFGYTKSVDV